MDFQEANSNNRARHKFNKLQSPDWKQTYRKVSVIIVFVLEHSLYKLHVRELSSFFYYRPLRDPISWLVLPCACRHIPHPTCTSRDLKGNRVVEVLQGRKNRIVNPSILSPLIIHLQKRSRNINCNYRPAKFFCRAENVKMTLHLLSFVGLSCPDNQRKKHL